MGKPYDPEHYVPTPSRTTVFFRTFVPWQLLRFIAINLRMLRMIFIGHHGRAPLRPILPPAADDPARGRSVAARAVR